jgi:hypothetical protein
MAQKSRYNENKIKKRLRSDKDASLSIRHSQRHCPKVSCENSVIMERMTIELSTMPYRLGLYGTDI